jgi:hypothetical protein
MSPGKEKLPHALKKSETKKRTLNMKPQRDEKPDKEKFKQQITGPEAYWCEWIRP